jgi:hypothetical protein
MFCKQKALLSTTENQLANVKLTQEAVARCDTGAKAGLKSGELRYSFVVSAISPLPLPSERLQE